MSFTYHRRQALEKEVKDLYARVTIGASGAPTLAEGWGIASIVNNGTGDYTITLQDKYPSLKFVDMVHQNSTGEDLNVQLHSEAVATSKTIRVLTITGSSATNPSSGDVLYFKIEVKNTSVR